MRVAARNASSGDSLRWRRAPCLTSAIRAAHPLFHPLTRARSIVKYVEKAPEPFADSKNPWASVATGGGGCCSVQ